MHQVTSKRLTLKVDFGRHAMQRAIAVHPARYKVLCCGRRWGKTHLGVIMAIERLLCGQRVWWVAPTHEIAQPAWRALREQCSLLARVGVPIEINRAFKQIKYRGGELRVRSADSYGGLRGDGLDYVIIDEAAYVPEDTWTLELRPALIDRQGGALLISTPNGDNWYRRVYDEAVGEQWARWQLPSWSNPYLDRAEIEALRKEMTELQWLQEIEAQFVDLAGGTMIARDAINECDWQPECETIAIGVDLAISKTNTADYTAIVCLGRDGDGNIYVLDVVRDRLSMHAAMQAVERLAERWRPTSIAVESVGYQAAMADELLRTTSLPVVKVTPRADKITRAQSLIARIEQGLFYVPAHAVWRDVYMRELTSFPAAEHDDMVDATVYALEQLKSTSLSLVLL
jgi:predicted phage terminase large subunit-like protein